MLEVVLGVVIGWCAHRFKDSLTSWFRRAGKKVERAIEGSAK